MKRRPGGKDPLGGRYWRLWSASVVSNLGDGVGAIAFPWLASAVTRNPVLIALGTVARLLPWLVFTLPAGVITDRVDRRRLMVGADVARAVFTAVIAGVVLAAARDLPSPAEVASGAEVPTNLTVYGVLVGAVLLLGFAEVLRDNAAQTLLPALVPAESLERANGSLWGAEMVANSFVGPPLGSLLLGVGFALPFFVNAGGFAVAAGLLFLIAGQFRARPASAAAPAPATPATPAPATPATPAPATPATPAPAAGWGGELKEGFLWLWRHPLLRPMAVILGLLNGLGMMVWATFVLFAQEDLDLETGLGTGVLGAVADFFGFESVGALVFALLMMGGAVGGVIGSVVAARVSRALGSGPSLYLTIIGGGLAALGTGLATRWWVAFLMTAVITFTGMLWNVITVSLRQAIIPDRLLGRVNSVYRFFGWGMMPLGSLLGGAVVALAGRWVSRSSSLRGPFFVAAGGHLLLLIYAAPRLTTAKIEAARAEVQGGSPHPPSSPADAGEGAPVGQDTPVPPSPQ